MKKLITAILAIILISIAAYFVFARNTKVTGRIDFETDLVNKDVPRFEVYVDGSTTPEEQVAWMPKFKKQGYVIQNDNGSVDIVLNSLKNGSVKVFLRGPDERDENNELVPVWVDFTSLKIDDVEILQETVSVWHNNSFSYVIDTEAGKQYNIHAEWKKSDK